MVSSDMLIREKEAAKIGITLNARIFHKVRFIDTLKKAMKNIFAPSVDLIHFDLINKNKFSPFNLSYN